MRSVGGFWDEAWRADVLERALGSPDAVALVHDEGSALTGFACAHDVAFRAYLSELVVAPGAQGGGVGAALLAELERRLGERGCHVVIADVWRDAERFYRARGWTPPAVVLLRKRLDRAAPGA
jgi:GNAT superfamily N-acetyltransferase